MHTKHRCTQFHNTNITRWKPDQPQHNNSEWLNTQSDQQAGHLTNT